MLAVGLIRVKQLGQHAPLSYIYSSTALIIKGVVELLIIRVGM